MSWPLYSGFSCLCSEAKEDVGIDAHSGASTGQHKSFILDGVVQVFLGQYTMRSTLEDLSSTNLYHVIVNEQAESEAAQTLPSRQKRWIC